MGNRFTLAESLDQAVKTARAHVRFDGGGRWRVYETRCVAGDGAARNVLGRVLAEGLERAAAGALYDGGNRDFLDYEFERETGVVGQGGGDGTTGLVAIVAQAGRRGRCGFG